MVKTTFKVEVEVEWSADDEKDLPSADYVRDRLEEITNDLVTGYHGFPDKWSVLKVTRTP